MSAFVRSAAAALGRTRRVCHRRSISESAWQERLDPYGEKKTLITKLEEFDVKLQREVVEAVENVKRMGNEDRNSLNRLLTFYGMPKGATREKLIWSCNVAVMFFVSSAAGAYVAHKEAHSEQAERAFV